MSSDETAPADASSAAHSQGARPLRIFAVLLWLALSLTAAVAIARMSVYLQAYYAPLGLFPVLVGIVLGASVVGLARLAGVDARLLVIVAAVVFSLLVAAAEHFFFYRDYLAALDRRIASDPKVAMLMSLDDADNFWEYLGRGTREQMLLWLLGAALTTTAAGVTARVVLGSRQRALNQVTPASPATTSDTSKPV